MPIGYPFPYFRPVAAVQFDRYNVDLPAKEVDLSLYYSGVNYGPTPNLIPRIWNMSLGYRGQLDQWSNFPTNFNTAPLPPVPIYPGRRGDNRSVSLAWNQYSQGQSADQRYIPSTFVGWTPNVGGFG